MTRKSIRINILMVGMWALSGVLIMRLFYIQVRQHGDFRALAESQYWNLQNIPAIRGQILSSDGFPLATNEASYLLFAQPREVEDPLQTAHDLAEILVDEEEFEEYKDRLYEVLSLDLVWVILEHNLSFDQRVRIEKAMIKGVGFEDEPERHYPEDTLAAHILGFVASNENGESQGYFGVEGSFDGDLRGKPGRVIEEQSASGAPILVGGHRRVSPTDGRDIVLTINRAVQYLVEKRLEEGVKEYGAASGSVIVMDPNSGDIIALVNYPTYSPGNFNEYTKELEVENEVAGYTIERRNLAISEVYEPGSVLKAVTISSGIDLGKIGPNTTFVDSGPVQYSDYVIDNWDGKHHGVQTVIQLLQKSNNIGAAWVGHLVGSENLALYLNEFGFGSPSGIELEGEDTGSIRNPQEWTDIDLATAAFGQGVSATPLQVLNAFNVIANGGSLMQPRIVSQMIEENKIIDIQPRIIRQVITTNTSETVTDLLVQAVEGGESKFFNLKNYKIAGKTGTAQIPYQGKYDPNKTNATFVGYLANSKKFSMIVRLDRPSTSIYAAETAVPLWMGIAEDLVNYYGIPPDKEI